MPLSNLPRPLGEAPIQRTAATDPKRDPVVSHFEPRCVRRGDDGEIVATPCVIEPRFPCAPDRPARFPFRCLSPVPSPACLFKDLSPRAPLSTCPP